LGLPLEGKNSTLWNYVDQRDEAEE